MNVKPSSMRWSLATTAVPPAGIQRDGPVSYTHLDVYKRQTFYLMDMVTIKMRKIVIILLS